VFLSSSKSFKQQLLWLQNEFATSVKLLENPKTLTAIWMPFIAVALVMLEKVSNARFGDTFHMDKSILGKQNCKSN